MSSAPWPGFPSIVKTVKLRWYTLELCLGLVSLVLLAHFVLILFRELTVCVFLAVGACRHSALYQRWRGGAHPHHWISNVDGDKQLQHQQTIVKGKTPTRRGYWLPGPEMVIPCFFLALSYVAMSKVTLDDKRSAMAAAVSGCCMCPNSHDGCHRPEWRAQHMFAETKSTLRQWICNWDFRQASSTGMKPWFKQNQKTNWTSFKTSSNLDGTKECK